MEEYIIDNISLEVEEGLDGIVVNPSKRVINSNREGVIIAIVGLVLFAPMALVGLGNLIQGTSEHFLGTLFMTLILGVFTIICTMLLLKASDRKEQFKKFGIEQNRDIQCNLFQWKKSGQYQ